MNTNRIAGVAGAAALLLALSACAGADPQFDDSARTDSRAAAAEFRSSEQRAAQAQLSELIREAKQAESRQATELRASVDTSVLERIREVKQSESVPVANVRELIREAKQAESEPAPETPTPMTPEQVREFKASQVK